MKATLRLAFGKGRAHPNSQEPKLVPSKQAGGKHCDCGSLAGQGMEVLDVNGRATTCSWGSKAWQCSAEAYSWEGFATRSLAMQRALRVHLLSVNASTLPICIPAG